MRRLALSLAALALVLAATPASERLGEARAASFNCAEAANPSERAICANAGLSALDGALGLAYQQRLAADPGVRQLQRGWLKARDAGCGRDVGCLRALTSAQLSWLRSGAPMTGALPRRVGVCSVTRVTLVGNRLENAPDSGSAIEEANGAWQISYDDMPAADRSRPGDAALVCLVSIPRHCPPGDNRGRTYAATNLRTLGAWFGADAEHMCGGA